MTAATLLPASKRTGFRSGASSVPLMKGNGVETFSPGSVTATSLLERIGGDFVVEKRELLFAGQEPGSLVPSGSYAVVEGGTDVMHGNPVSADYVTYDYSRMAERVDEISERLGGTMEGGFLLRDGGIMVFVLGLPQSLVIGQDRSEMKLLACAGHGGEAALSLLPRWFRLFCANQFPGLASLATGGGKRGLHAVSERHTAPGAQRVDNSPQIIEVASKMVESDGRIAEILGGIEISDREIVEFLDGEIRASSDRGYAAKQNKVDKVLGRFATESASFGSNVWTGYQAIQWWEETKGEVTKADGNRYTRTLNRSVSGDHTPFATKFAKLHLPDMVKAEALREAADLN